MIYQSIYIKAKLADFVPLYLCVRVARRRAVAMQRGRFLFGQF
jgi:hypothetical protein